MDGEAVKYERMWNHEAACDVGRGELLGGAADVVVLVGIVLQHAPPALLAVEMHGQEVLLLDRGLLGNLRLLRVGVGHTKISGQLMATKASSAETQYQ